MKRFITWGLLLLLMMGTVVFAKAEEARDMAAECKIKVSIYGDDKKKMLDDINRTMWETVFKGGFVEVTTKDDSPCQGVYIQWGQEPVDVVIQVPGEGEKEWVDVKTCTEKYFNQYIPFDEPLTHFRVQSVRKDVQMGIIKLHVFSEGEVPSWVQRWQPFEGKADLMVLTAHPDDELLFMGGVIPYYNTVEEKNVIDVHVVRMAGYRKTELLNGLWHCGVRTYPELPGGKFPDKYTMGKKECLNIWGEEKLLEYVTEMIRKYQPDVIVTHDVDGEYGHGAHKACCYAVQKCIEFAADPRKYPASADTYGAWQVKKAYIHLYEGELGQIDFDWRIPMEAFDGKTIHEITSEAFELHQSQYVTGTYAVEDFGAYDNSLFGLYYSTVGPDTGMNDLFENID